MTKKFIAQAGSNNTVRVYDASTGALHRIFNFDGNIVSPPICTEEDMYVSICDAAGNTHIKYYTVPGFNIKRVTSL